MHVTFPLLSMLLLKVRGRLYSHWKHNYGILMLLIINTLVHNMVERYEALCINYYGVL